jgi:dCTP deaminase
MYAPEPQLYYSASARLQGLKIEIAQLRLVKYPTESPKQLLRVLDKSCDRLQGLANDHLVDWQNGVKDRSSILDALRFLHDSIGSLAKYLAIFETAGFEKARPEVALPLEMLLKERIPASVGDEFIFHATHEFNFFYTNFYRELTGHLFFLDEDEERLFYDGLPNHIALIALPAIERDNIFSLIILLHELAHYYDQSQDPPLSQADLQQAVNTQMLEDWVKEAKDIKHIPAPLRGKLGIPPEVLDFFLRYSILLRIATAATWLREITADIIAARLGGISFYLTLKKFVGFFPFEPGGSYPPNYRRFHAVAEVLLNPTDGIEKAQDVQALCAKAPYFANTLNTIFGEIRRDYKSGDVHAELARSRPDASAPAAEKEAYLEYRALQILESIISDALNRVRDAAGASFPPATCCRLSSKILEAASYLNERIPPAQMLRESQFSPPNWLKVEEILCAAWLAWIHECSAREDSEAWTRRRRVTSRVALRGIELSDYMQRHFRDRAENPDIEKNFIEAQKVLKSLAGATDVKEPDRVSGVVGRRALFSAIMRERISERLVVTPILDAGQIGEASIDVRLGNGFIAIRRARTKGIKVTPSGIWAPGDYKENISLSYKGRIILHPDEFMLGSTLEYICLPPDMMAYVIGKSSLGRLGLIIATATHVAPGFRGTLTLELSNVGTVPIELRPRAPIAQLVFHRLEEPIEEPYHLRGTYSYTTGPEMPPLRQEPEEET